MTYKEIAMCFFFASVLALIVIVVVGRAVNWYFFDYTLR